MVEGFGIQSMGSSSSWEQTRATRRNGFNSVEDAIKSDILKLGTNQVYQTKAGDTFWDIAEAVQLLNSQYAKMDTGKLVQQIKNSAHLKGIDAGTQLDLNGYLDDKALPAGSTGTSAPAGSSTINPYL